MDRSREILLKKINKRKKRASRGKAWLYVIIFVLLFGIGLSVGAILYAKLQPDETMPSQDETSSITAFKEQVNTDGAPDKSEQTKPQPKTHSSVLLKLKDSFVRTLQEKYPGTEVSILIKDLDTGAKAIHNNKKLNSASMIKLFIMETVYKQTEAGEYELTDEKQKALERMITESHNKSATVFIDDFGGVSERRKVEASNIINKTIADSGYAHTELNRKMHDTTPPEGPSGYENYTCVEDVAVLLEGIYNKTLFKQPYNTHALELLKKQQRTTKIPAKITEQYPDVIVANKTGELSQVENDAALIMSEDFNLIFVIMVNDIPKKADGSTDYKLKEKVQETISELALELVEAYKNRK